MKRAKQRRVLPFWVTDTMVATCVVAKTAEYLIMGMRAQLEAAVRKEIKHECGYPIADPWHRTEYDMLRQAWLLVTGCRAVLRRKEVRG